MGKQGVRLDLIGPHCSASAFSSLVLIVMFAAQPSVAIESTMQRGNGLRGSVSRNWLAGDKTDHRIVRMANVDNPRG